MKLARSGSRGPLVTAVIFALSAGLAALAVYDALRVGPTPRPVAPPLGGVEADPEGDVSLPLDVVLAAVDADPLRPERSAPGRRLAVGDAPAGSGSVPATGELRLVGTAVLPDGGGFALCALGSEPPRLVRVTETVGPYRLSVVRSGEAEFTDASGQRIVLSVPPGGQ